MPKVLYYDNRGVWHDVIQVCIFLLCIWAYKNYPSVVTDCLMYFFNILNTIL